MQNTNLQLSRGDDQTIGVNLTNSDGTYYNLSGCELIFNLRKNSPLAIPILTKNITGHYGAVSGASYITLSKADTSIYKSDILFYDIKLKTTEDKLTTLSFGNLILYPR